MIFYGSLGGRLWVRTAISHAISLWSAAVLVAWPPGPWPDLSP